MITWPMEIIDSIARRRSVLFLGSGISANSKSADGLKTPPTWENFLRKAMAQITDTAFIETLLAEKDYLTACDIIVQKTGKTDFERIAKEEFLLPRYSKHFIHEQILKLDSRIVVTPNVDKIYEVYAQSETCGTILVKNYYDSDIVNKVRSDEHIILKIHGTLDVSTKMIFTRKQYTNARYEFAAFYKILEALTLTHTFIFLGCGYSDPDIRLILENYTFNFPDSYPHYMVSPFDKINDDMKNILKENSNIEIITYDPVNHHKELLDSLEELVNLVESKREVIAGEMTW